MNLAFLIGHFPPGAFGGAELQAEGWARRLAARHRITVITRRDPPSQPAIERRDGFDVVRLPVSRVPLARTALDLAAISRAIGRLAPRPDLALCFQTFISGLAGVRAQQRFGIPAVVWVRGESEYALRGAWAARAIAPRVWARACGVLVQSDAVRAGLLDALAEAAPAVRAAVVAKLDVVPNGIDLPDAVAPPGGRVLTVGRLIPEKGMDVVIDAVAGLQGQLTVAGAGPERERLEARARRHGLEARFEGFVDRERLATLLREAWVVVLAARRGEGLPNAVLEAFAEGRPVIGTPIAGVRDLIVDGVNGLIVPPGDPHALRDALARLSHERGLAERMGRAARETAAAYAWPRVVPRLEAALERWAAR
ncbi:MAG: glycosyltransferase family 4 protein [Candidatus Eisenbacteria bacterium]|nr:glycosyltransferase family 4 protein [Candidatus Eisenbacteria bacterium]